MDRKEMIRLLEAHSGAKAKYMGAPSFDYQIIVRDEPYRISKDGAMRDQNGNGVDFETVLQVTVEEMPDDNFMEKEPESDTFVEIAVPIEEHTGLTLRNLVNMVYSKQEHIKKAFGMETDILSKEFVEAVNGNGVKTLEHFRDAVIKIGAEKCPGIDFDFDGNRIIFKLGIRSEESKKVEAGTTLVSLLSKSAKEQKHAAFKPSANDNMKFTMRVWLIRLGFIGSEYKSARQTLLKSLEGNSAFRTPSKKDSCSLVGETQSNQEVSSL